MSFAVVPAKKSGKRKASQPQQTFDRLRKKIVQIQKDIEKLKADLDLCVEFEETKIKPVKVKKAKSLEGFIMSLFYSLKMLKNLNRREKDDIRHLIDSKINELASLIAFKDIPSEIIDIYKEISGKDYHDKAAKDLAEMKRHFQNESRSHGVDIDLSKLDVNDSEEELNRKVVDAMQAAMRQKMESMENEEHFEKSNFEQPKSKKQVELENKQAEIALLQKKGLSSIYKRLAKVLHPDLEPDPDLKQEKVELMKKLTCAYEENDLNTLLYLEMEWVSQLEGSNLITDEDQLNVYNSLLVEQIDDLQNELSSVPDQVEYLNIHNYIDYFIPGKNLPALKKILKDMNEACKGLSQLSEMLTKDRTGKTIRSIVDDFRFQNMDEELLAFLGF